MNINFINEWGISSEPIEQFIARNNKKACPKYPQNLTASRDVILSKKIPFLPIVDFEKSKWHEMHREAQKLSRHYVPHRVGDQHQGWSSLCIHGLSSVHTEAHHVYGYKNVEDVPFRWTDVSDFCPTIKDFLINQFDYIQFYRVRIMKLIPGGYIKPHRDSLTEEENFLGPINIALNNPQDCDFYMDGIGKLPFVQGAVISLNLYNVHAVVNRSREDRYHLIVHGRRAECWQERIYRSYLQYRSDYA